MGMGFDTYQVFRGKARFPAWLVFFTDLAFWLASVVGIFWVLVRVNDGVVRFPIFIGMLAGAWLYFWAGSKHYIRFLLAVIRFCKWLYRTILLMIDTCIVRPILFLYRMILTLVGFLLSLIFMVLQFVWRILSWPFRPLLRWGHQLGKKTQRKGKGIWQQMANWLRSRTKKQ